ncbi:MAG: NAD(P)/FAD-dependent oxidoreductase [Candidatus Promineifilaceae bacterium]
MKVDVAILGGGIGGAACAMFLAREGIQATIIERERFPRYHIGESMTGAAGQVIRQLGLEAEMLKHKHPRKKGVVVYGPKGHTSWWVPVTGRDENWGLYDSETWQVRRSDFDTMMLAEAVARGAKLIHGRATRPLLSEAGAVRGLEVRLADGGSINVESEVLLDCSGQATFLANAGATGPKYVGNYDKQIAIFSQVEGAIRDDDSSRMKDHDNALIFYKEKFHWAWFIPLDEEVVSVGVGVPAGYFLDKKESTRDFLVRELGELNGELARRLPEIKLAEDVHVIPNYSYQVSRFCGPGYICIGDAHRFIDPIYSFGMTVALREAQLAAPAVRAYLEGANRDQPNPFADYERFTEQGIDVLEDMIDLFWEQPLAFAWFVHFRHVEQMTDAFAGRIYENQPSEAILAFRKMLGRTEERERSYQNGAGYSVPIGSRYHPERAPLWQANSPVPTTEEWLGPR